ncbi:MAG: 50S ribosomal protein L29 [Burkholderiales bacterium]
MNAAELKGKSTEELQRELNSLLKAQFGLRMQKATQQLTNTSQLGKVRRDIARVRTVLHEKARNDKGQGKA